MENEIKEEIKVEETENIEAVNESDPISIEEDCEGFEEEE